MINYYMFRLKRVLCSNKGESGIGAILGIAIALTVAAFIIFPGVKTLAGSIVDGLQGWWGDTIADEIFSTSVTN